MTLSVKMSWRQAEDYTCDVECLSVTYCIYYIFKSLAFSSKHFIDSYKKNPSQSSLMTYCVACMYLHRPCPLPVFSHFHIILQCLGCFCSSPILENDYFFGSLMLWVGEPVFEWCVYSNSN